MTDRTIPSMETVMGELSKVGEDMNQKTSVRKARS